MIPVSTKRLWIYPIFFGLIGALTGLLLRYFFASPIVGFPLKNLVHSHSHVMLLGFLFNALVVLIWTNFTKGIDRVSFRYFLVLQVCVAAMFVAFIVQGYALFSILFSTLHLWISYMFLVRLWKRLVGSKVVINLIKLGIVFHFISSIGPYCLGPLMVFEMKESPWYQQAIFFYLHFQYFGSLFVWLLAVFIHRTALRFSKNNWILIGLSLIGLYAHSLDYNFDHYLIQLIGSISSLLLFLVFLSFVKQMKNQKRAYQIIFGILIVLTVCNMAGSLPYIAKFIETDRFILIAWLHFLFLGLFVPFIWIELPVKFNSKFWMFYGVMVLMSELLLLFHDYAYNLFEISIMWSLLVPYAGITICFCIAHLRYLLGNEGISTSV